MIPRSSRVTIEVLEADKRPVSAVADSTEIRDVHSIEVFEDPTVTIQLVFDSGKSLSERILVEQFSL